MAREATRNLRAGHAVQVLHLTVLQTLADGLTGPPGAALAQAYLRTAERYSSAGFDQESIANVGHATLDTVGSYGDQFASGAAYAVSQTRGDVPNEDVVKALGLAADMVVEGAPGHGASVAQFGLQMSELSSSDEARLQFSNFTLDALNDPAIEGYDRVKRLKGDDATQVLHRQREQLRTLAQLEDPPNPA